MKKISIGIIGCGKVAQSFHLPNLFKIPAVEIAGVVDRQFTNAKIIAQKFNAKKAYKTLEDMIENTSLDALIISTPTALHYEHAKLALENNINLLIEKPVSFEISEIDELIKLSEKKKLKVVVAMNQRFRNDAMMIKNYINNGDVGKVDFIKCGWLQKRNKLSWSKSQVKKRRGVLLDLGISMLDSILWMNEFREVKSVQCYNFKRLNKEFEDLSLANIRFKDGKVASIECSWAIYSETTKYYFDVYGADGSITLNPLQLNKGDFDIIRPFSEDTKKSNFEIHKASYESELRHFLNCILGLVPMFSDLKQAKQTMFVIEALYRSADENKEIILS